MGEPMKLLEVFAIYGIGSSAVLKILCMHRYSKEMTALSNFIFKLCRENVTGRRAERLKRRLPKNIILYKWFSFSIAASVILFVAHPIKTLIVDRELISLVPIEIIFVDQSTQAGFLIANLCFLVMGLYAAIGTVTLDVIFISSLCNYTIQVDMIEEDIKDLDEMWNSKIASTLAYRQMFFVNICKKCQDMSEYINEVKKIFDTKIFLFFCFSYVSQIICLYEIAVNNWIPGYGIAIGMFLEMMFFCLMGTQLAIQNERLCHMLQQSYWYKYDLKSQKMFGQLLQSCMNAKEICIGPLAPLSVMSGVQIVKSIYSYYTILMEVI